MWQKNNIDGFTHCFFGSFRAWRGGTAGHTTQRLGARGLEMLFAKVCAHLKVMQKVGAARVKKRRGEAPPNLGPEISAGQGHQKEDIEAKHLRSGEKDWRAFGRRDGASGVARIL